MKAKWFTIFALWFAVALMILIMGTASDPVRAYPNFNPIPTPDEPPAFLDFLSTVVKTEHLLQSSREMADLSPLSAVIVNGDFESGRTGWVEYSYQGWPLILHKDDLPITPHGGNWAAWLGGDDNEIAYISQAVSIPAGGILTFWEWIASEDACGYDFAWVRINNINVATINLCSSNNTNGWVQRTVNLGTYAGQTVSLQIRVETDGSLNSNYFVDDVVLSGSTPGGDRYVYLPLVLRNFWAGFFDDFSNPQSGWPVGEIPTQKWGYLNGEYQILIREPNGWMLVSPGEEQQLLYLPENYRIEVDARQVSAYSGSYGLMFGIRWTSDSYEGYLFLVYPPTREYLLEKRTLDGSWYTLVDWTYSPYIQGGTGVNSLRVDRIGTAIYLYANNALLTTFYDSSFMGSGRDAGLAVATYEDYPVDVRFDNFRASQP